MNSNKLKPDEIRRRILKLSRERAKIQKKLSIPPQMIEGCIHTVYKKCGKKDYHSSTGAKHGPYAAIVRKVDGMPKLTYVDRPYVIDKAVAYKNYNKELATLRNTNKKDIFMA